jgi:hypothetical protein
MLSKYTLPETFSASTIYNAHQLRNLALRSGALVVIENEFGKELDKELDKKFVQEFTTQSLSGTVPGYEIAKNRTLSQFWGKPHSPRQREKRLKPTAFP